LEALIAVKMDDVLDLTQFRRVLSRVMALEIMVVEEGYVYGEISCK
jgi:hypothetical protein